MKTSLPVAFLAAFCIVAAAAWADEEPRPNSEPRPQLWGIDPGRWYEFNGHVPLLAGGDISHPSAATVVKAGRVPTTDYIAAGALHW